MRIGLLVNLKNLGSSRVRGLSATSKLDALKGEWIRRDLKVDQFANMIPLALDM